MTQWSKKMRALRGGRGSLRAFKPSILPSEVTGKRHARDFLSLSDSQLSSLTCQPVTLANYDLSLCHGNFHELTPPAVAA